MIPLRYLDEKLCRIDLIWEHLGEYRLRPWADLFTQNTRIIINEKYMIFIACKGEITAIDLRRRRIAITFDDAAKILITCCYRMGS